MKKLLILALVLVVIVVVALAIVLGGGGDDDEVAGDVKVPINFEGASNVGSISIELVYDSAVLDVVEVKAGELAENAMMEYNIKNPGRVIIGMVDSSGINGDGAVAMVGFSIVDAEGTTLLALESVETHDAATLVDIINEASDGSFQANGQSVTAPLISFAP